MTVKEAFRKGYDYAKTRGHVPTAREVAKDLPHIPLSLVEVVINGAEDGKRGDCFRLEG